MNIYRLQKAPAENCLKKNFSDLYYVKIAKIFYIGRFDLSSFKPNLREGAICPCIFKLKNFEYVFPRLQTLEELSYNVEKGGKNPK